MGRGAGKRDEDWQVSARALSSKPNIAFYRLSPIIQPIMAPFYSPVGQWPSRARACHHLLPSACGHKHPADAEPIINMNLAKATRIHCRLKDIPNDTFHFDLRSFQFSGSLSCLVRNHFHGSSEPDSLLLMTHSAVLTVKRHRCHAIGGNLIPPPRLEPYPLLSTVSRSPIVKFY